MGSYEVTCANRVTCHRGGHISDVGVSRKKSGTRVVEVSLARLMLSAGDILYVRDPATNDRLGVRKGRCACGAKALKLDIDGSHVLDLLPVCVPSVMDQESLESVIT